MIVKGGVPIRRIPKAPSVSIQAGQRVFHKRADGTYDPKTITLKAEVKNVTNPSYRWGRMVNGAFQTLGVNLSAMTIQPSHAGVIAVQVRGDNIPTYVQDYTSVSTVNDGQPAVNYKIEVRQLDKTVTSIPCDHEGNPKIYYQAIASLYKTVGEVTELCSDYLCLILWYKGNTQVRSLISPNPTASCAIDVSFDFDNVRIFFTDGGTPCANVTIPKQLDGQPAVQYKIVVKQLENVITSIPCGHDGYPKIYYQATAYLYKITGDKEELCSDYICIVGYQRNGILFDSLTSTSNMNKFTFNVDGNYDSIRIAFTDGDNIYADVTVPKLYDGQPGQKGLPGCAIRRSEWKAGIEYRNDEAINVVTRYLDIAMVRANNSVGWRGYKCLQTHVSAESNKPGNATYWEELPTSTVGILASLIIARDAKLDFLSGNEIRILDANNKVTAGVSGSGNGETGIRFYAGSDDPQISPYRVNELGELYSTKANIKGNIKADSGQIGNLNILPDGDIMGTDGNGTPRIYVTARDIEDIEDILGGASYYEPVVDRTNNYKSIQFPSTYLPDQSVEVLLSSAIDGFLSFKANVSLIVLNGTSRGFPYVFGLKYIIELYKKNGESNVYQKNMIEGRLEEMLQYGTGNHVYDIPVSVRMENTNKNDVYKMVFKVSDIACSNTIDDKKLDITLCPAFTPVSQYYLPSATMVGNNGITSCWGTDSFFTYTKDKGMTCIQGQYGIRLTSSGLQKLLNGVWVSL